jgi:hypothetical protein
MATKFRARFDGRVFIPEEPVDVPSNELVKLEVIGAGTETRDAPQGLLALLADAEQYPGNPDAVTDAAAEHDHYLYDTQKRYSRYLHRYELSHRVVRKE